MTRSRDEVIEAQKKYLDMKSLLGVVPAGGLRRLFCTGVSAKSNFDMLRPRGVYAGRAKCRCHSGAGPDHPWFAHVNESRYLKAVLPGTMSPLLPVPVVQFTHT